MIGDFFCKGKTSLNVVVVSSINAGSPEKTDTKKEVVANQDTIFASPSPLART